MNKTLATISFLSGLSTLLILGHLLKFTAYGIDITDEGYYLNSISSPFLYKNSISQFGFIYHHFYNLFDGNIIWLRKFNLIVIFGLSFALTYLSIVKIINKLEKKRGGRDK